MLHKPVRGASAAEKQPLFEVKRLSPASAGLNAEQEGRLNSRLFDAVRNRKTDEAELLISMGANASHSDANGYSLLMCACSAGSVELAELLLKHRADSNAKSRSGWTPLMYTFMHDNLQLAKLLITYGADIDARNRHGFTPLMFACMYKSRKIIDLLLGMNVDVNAVNAMNETALMLACIYSDDADIVQKLLDKGADNSITDMNGLTARALAEQFNHSNILSVLDSAT